jgi:excisionase family DNA binding protein
MAAYALVNTIWELGPMPEEDRKTYDVPEAGRLLGISRNAAYDAAKSGQIPTIRIGNRILVPKAKFDRILSGEAV